MAVLENEGSEVLAGKTHHIGNRCIGDSPAFRQREATKVAAYGLLRAHEMKETRVGHLLASVEEEHLDVRTVCGNLL